MKRRPLGITFIAVLYFCGAAGYSVLFVAWIFSREVLVNWIEHLSPTESLGPTLLLQMPTAVSLYFLTMAVFCAVVGNGLRKLHRWSWIVTLIFLAATLIFDAALLVHIFGHLSPWLISLGLLRLAFLAALLAYLTAGTVRRAFARQAGLAPAV
jgi:hypothetical protein